MTLATFTLLAAMKSSEAIAILLNGAQAVPPEKFKEAQTIVRNDAEAGKPLQQFVIAVTTDDKELAARFGAASRPRIERLAAEKDNPLAWYLLSVERNDLRLLRRAAEGGNVQALNALGTVEISALCADKNISTNEAMRALQSSFKCFKRAVESKDVNALINLGTCYLRGFGCEPDFTMAFACFREAAEKGHPEGMDNLSACYELGHGVPPDPKLSLYWKMRARAVRGDKAADRWLREQ